MFLALAVLISTGAVNPNCTKEMVCQDGYTKTVRPPASYTNRLKRAQMAARHLPGDPSSYEEDHEVPLELCGCATCPENLWPEPWPEARKKDVDETHLHRLLCKGQLSLIQAQESLKMKWRIH